MTGCEGGERATGRGLQAAFTGQKRHARSPSCPRGRGWRLARAREAEAAERREDAAAARPGRQAGAGPHRPPARAPRRAPRGQPSAPGGEAPEPRLRERRAVRRPPPSSGSPPRRDAGVSQRPSRPARGGHAFLFVLSDFSSRALGGRFQSDTVPSTRRLSVSCPRSRGARRLRPRPQALPFRTPAPPHRGRGRWHARPGSAAAAGC